MRRVALIIGNDRYEDPEIRPLDFAVADATELGGFLRHKAGYERVTPLFNADDRAILLAAEELLSDLAPGDLFLFFFAGHATTARNQHLLLCAQSRLAWVQKGHEHGTLPFTLLRDTTAVPGVERVFILDACRGEVRRARDGASAQFRGENQLRDLAASPIREGLGARLPKLLCSCGEGEHALESPKLRHGLFTMALLEEFETARTKGGARLSQTFLGRLQRRMNQLAQQHQLEGNQRPWLNRFDEEPVVLVPSGDELPGRERPARGPRSGLTSVPSLPACPGCGATHARETFRCERCGRPHLCQDHFSAADRCCEWCAAEFELRPATFLPLQTETEPDSAPNLSISSDPAHREEARRRECETRVGQLEATIADLESGRHPALQAGQEELRRLEQLANRCHAEADARAARLPAELVAAVDREIESGLPSDPHLAHRLAPETPAHVAALHRRWHDHRRKVTLLLDSARATWDGIRASELSRLQRRRAELQAELLQLQQSDFAQAVRTAFLPGFDPAGGFPEDKWTALLPRLRERRYPWTQTEARQRAVRLFDGWCQIEKQWVAARRRDDRETALREFLAAHPQSHRGSDAARDIAEETEWRAARLAAPREAALRAVLVRHPLGHRRTEIEADLLEERRWTAARQDPGDRATLLRELLLAFPKGHRRADAERDLDEELQWLAARSVADRQTALAAVQHRFPSGHRRNDAAADLDEEARWLAARQTLERENALREMLSSEPPLRHRRADVERDLREELDWQNAFWAGGMPEVARFLTTWPDGHRAAEAIARSQAWRQEEFDWQSLLAHPTSEAALAYLERYPASERAAAARRLLKSSRRREVLARLLGALGPFGKPAFLIPATLLLAVAAVGLGLRYAPELELSLTRLAIAWGVKSGKPTPVPPRPPPDPTDETPETGTASSQPEPATQGTGTTPPIGGPSSDPTNTPAAPRIADNAGAEAHDIASSETHSVTDPAPAPTPEPPPPPPPPSWYTAAQPRLPDLLTAVRAAGDLQLESVLTAFPTEPSRAEAGAAEFQNRLASWWETLLFDSETRTKLLECGLPESVLPSSSVGAPPALDEDLMPRIRNEFERRTDIRRSLRRLVDISSAVPNLIPSELERTWGYVGMKQQLRTLVQALFRRLNVEDAEKDPGTTLAQWGERIFAENTNAIGAGLRGPNVYELPAELGSMPEARRRRESERLGEFIAVQGYKGFEQWREEIRAANRGRRRP